jgi:hypothetical protein
MSDVYSRYSRITPIILVALPPALPTLLWLPQLGTEARVVGLGILAALIPLFDQLGRGRGRRREPILFEAWGGAPTTQLLRWRGPESTLVQGRRHQAVERVTGVRLPTAAEESQDGRAADEAYSAAVRTLRALTFDSPAVQAENRNYGLRRNLLGLRPLGLLTSTLGLVIVLASILTMGARKESLLAAIAVLGIDVALLAMWFLVVREGWVREAAWIYAERLLDRTESLDSTSGSGPESREATRSGTSSRTKRSSFRPRSR